MACMIVTRLMSSSSHPALLQREIAEPVDRLSASTAVGSGRLNEVGEQAERAGNQLVELVVQHERYMRMPPAPDLGGDQGALERILARIVQGQELLVDGIVLRREVEAPLLVP